MEPLTPAVGYIMRALQIPIAIMCILCFKWRFLADYFYHVESVMHLLAMLNLNYSNFLLDFQSVGSRAVQIYILFAIATRAELIVSVLGMALRLTVGLHLVWAKPLDLQTVFIYALTILVTFVCFTLTNMLIIFFSEVYSRLKIAEKASVNLLNGMHEGVLILSHKTSHEPNQFYFCNKSAQRLITTFLGPI